MKKPKIILNSFGVDLDGTMNVLDDYQLEKAKKFFFWKDPVNTAAYDIQDIYKVSKKVRKMFWAIYVWPYCITYPGRSDAPFVVNGLSELGYHPYMITAKVYVMDGFPLGTLFRKFVFDFVEREGLSIDPDDIIFCSEKYSAMEKQEHCGTLGIPWIFEDKADNIWAISQNTNTHVLVPEATYNECVEDGPKITKIKTLRDGYDIIMEKDAEFLRALREYIVSDDMSVFNGLPQQKGIITEIDTEFVKKIKASRAI